MQTTQKINVLNVKRNLDKMYSGATRVVFDILNTLEGDKFNNNLFSLNIDKKYANKNHLNFKICRKKLFGNSFSKRVHFDNKASDFINKGNFDLVIGHGDNLYQDILYLHNCVHLAHELIHNEPLPEDNQLNLFHTKLLNSRNFKRIIANSNLMKSDLIARFNISEDIIDVIYPSFNPNTFYVQNATSIKNNKNILGIKENEIVIGFVTSGDFQKRGLDNFIKIIEDLPDSIIKNVKILIVGKGDLPEIKNKEVNEKLVKLPITNKIEDIYNIIDIFLYPARIEEFGLVVSEAMACGCAIITTEHVGANELFTGLSKECICNSNQMMREKIEQLVTDAPLRKEISITNALDVQKTSLENFSSLFLKTLSKIDIE